MGHIKKLPLELQKVAEIELGERTERIENDVQILKTWIEQQPHLNARLDEQFLIQYLRGCKYSLERAKKKLDLFYTLKSKFPELFNATDVNGTKFKEIYQLGFCLPLPIPLNTTGPRLFYMNFKDVASNGQCGVEEIFQIANAMHEIMIMEDPYAGINGVLYILDLKDVTINWVTQFTPNFLRKIVQFYEKSLPLRIKGAHFINTPRFFHSVLNILLPLLSEKLRQRIFIYGTDYDNLYRIIPQKYLPTNLDGENGSTEQILQNFNEKWLEYLDYFKQNEEYGTNELLRPGKPIDFNSLFGLEGSFRKLNID